MIELRHLIHVLAVAEHRNFGRAARAVNLSQPALTRSVQVAEEILGVRLFERSRSGVELTEFGRMVVESARPVTQTIRDLERDIELRRGLASGSLAIALAPYPGVLSGPRAVARFIGDYPAINCHVSSSDWVRAAEEVLHGNVDAAIADLEVAAADSRFCIETLNTGPAIFGCRPGHPLIGRSKLTIDELSEYPWAATRAPSRMRAFLPDRATRSGHWDERTGSFIPAIETDVMSDFAVLARESDALLVCTLTMVEADLVAGRVVALPFSAPWFRMNYGVITRKGRTLPPAVDEFIRIVREIETELDEREERLRRQYL